MPKTEMMYENMLEKPLKAVSALATRRIEIECGRIPHEFRNVPIRKLLNWLLIDRTTKQIWQR